MGSDTVDREMAAALVKSEDLQPNQAARLVVSE